MKNIIKFGLAAGISFALVGSVFAAGSDMIRAERDFTKGQGPIKTNMWHDQETSGGPTDVAHANKEFASEQHQHAVNTHAATGTYSSKHTGKHHTNIHNPFLTNDR